ncbi:MAG: hypothetical protein IT479_07130 [Xanthomonadales bacterium]|nr:hypothetical protein [Xanthomonadales bacterium]MCC6593035.1 hypothetical protein [Xanthomonadales bacterium]MCE7931076.1 hypothetical protein [Xanthomonadales bacterium PRO6]
MFERFSRSWALIKASASVLQKDKELMVFPAVSSVAAILVAASFLAPLFLMLQGNPEAFEQKELSPIWYVWAFAFYMSQYFVIFFFNTALVGAASIRLEGGDPTVADGLRIAWSKIGTILGYAAIAATVGMILRAIEERAGWIGKWVAGLLGAAWTVATFMVVPVLVHKNIGPIDAVKESALLLKKTWGENLIGQGGVGLVFGLMQFGLWALVGFLVVAAVSTKSIGLVVTVVVTGIVCSLILALLQAALSGIYSAALYRYAEGHVNAPEFSGELLRNAFATRKR